MAPATQPYPVLSTPVPPNWTHRKTGILFIRVTPDRLGSRCRTAAH